MPKALFRILISSLSGVLGMSSMFSSTRTQNATVAVGPQYDTTHVYTDKQHMDALVRAIIATFGGYTTERLTLTVTPTPSVTESQLIVTPVGMLSIFAFKSPIPQPFGSERTGYLVQDMNEAVRAAKASGAEVLVQPFKDPVGLDAIVRWKGGFETQLYWHFKAPHYAPFQAVPENRFYASEEHVDDVIRGFGQFSGGKVVSDDRNADGVEVRQPAKKFRKVRIQSAFGWLVLLVTNGQLTYPFGSETTGYEVSDLEATLNKARIAGADVLVGPRQSPDRRFAMLVFPGGYVAEVHTTLK